MSIMPVGSPDEGIRGKTPARRILNTNYSLHARGWNWDTEPLGVLLIWEGPQVGSTYSIGVDTSDGVGKDRSAILVNRVGTRDRPDELVAEWVANVNPVLLPPYIYAIARLYFDALVAIECNRGDGAMVQDILLREYGYSNLYIWRWRDKAGRQASTRLGWFTNAQTRPILWTKGVQWLRDHKWRVNSPWFIEELADFGYNAERAEAAAVSGAYDDRLMAGFIALTAGKDWLRDADLTATIEREEAKQLAPPYNPQAMDISAEEADNIGEWGGHVFY